MSIHPLLHTVTLIILLLYNEPAAPKTYQIVPENNITTKACPTPTNSTVTMPCITLDQFASVFSDLHLDTFTLNFSPGNHLLTHRIIINSTASVTLKSRSLSNLSKINCLGFSGFVFINASSLYVERLEFTKCINDQSNGGAFHIYNVTSVIISQCLFTNNRVTAQGGAIQIQNTMNATIQNSKFQNNSAFCDSNIVAFYGFCTCQAFGGAVSVYNSKVVITATSFDSNAASCGGGAIHFVSSNLKISNTLFTRNSIRLDKGAGGAMISRFGSIQVLHSMYTSNKAKLGGAMYCFQTSITIGDTHYRNNSAKTDGGALWFSNSNKLLSVSDSCFLKNKAEWTGGAIHVSQGTLYNYNTFFKQNSAPMGGALYVHDHVVVSQSYFSSNRADSSGGAIHANGAGNLSVNSYNSQYINNTATIHGGVVFLHMGSLHTVEDHYTNSSASEGGAIWAYDANITSSGSSYMYCKAYRDGGAIFARKGSINSTHSRYESNNAQKKGGAIYSDGSTLSINFCSFSKSTANHGAAMYQNNVSIEIEQTIFNNNIALMNSDVIHLTNVRGLWEGLLFSNNHGSMYIFFSELNFSGQTMFLNNTGTAGGAITSIQSTISFQFPSNVTISGNNAKYGGGILLSESKVTMNTPNIAITRNRANTSGGGIYGYHSQIEIQLNLRTSTTITISGNSANQHGGGIHAIASNIQITQGFLQFDNNNAIFRGGAIYLEQGSKIYLYKATQEKLDQYLIKLLFINNSACHEGGVYVSDETNTGVLCKTAIEQVSSIPSEECFIQTVRLYFAKFYGYSEYNYINTFFKNNKAQASGNDIYGGLLDRCRINPFSEITSFAINGYYLPNFNSFDYVKATVEFDSIVDYDHLTHPYKLKLLSQAVTRYNVREIISSDAGQVCFCINHTHYCDYRHPNIFVKRGEMFTIIAATVDQVENPVSSAVITSVLSDRTSIKVGQSRQTTITKCTELTYNVYSTAHSASLILFSSGPCGDKGISRKVLNITFLDCECPNGFQPSPIENECKCECDPSLDPFVTNCQLEGDVITVVRQINDVWINYINVDNVTGNITGFLYTRCPQDYCIKEPANISISLPTGVDKQCAFNRSGYMCGKCSDGLSLVLGSSKCLPCSDKALYLLIAFALAGIALVAFILILNLTVATGSIHGLIFYANILAANNPTFLVRETKYQYFVIAWLNLDLGVETCFYDGMESYAKVLLQLVFPSYVLLLIILIILLSKYSGRFARILGSKNPVATLCTLILLSYSKLLRTIIASLQYTFLNFPDGSKEIVWLYDANIPYFKSEHNPRFVVAAFIVILGSVFTALLFFGQWFRKYSYKKLLKWARNTKYNAFIDAYHAPFNHKHRYWIGILLLARIIHHFASAIINESAHSTVVGCFAVGLVLLKLLITKIYKSWLLDILETSFLINLLLLAIFTNYSKHIIGNQTDIANTSLLIALATFCGILFYHTHAYVLMNIKMYHRLFENIKQKITTMKTKKPVRQPRNHAPSRNYYHQYRESALDIISPITPDDYNNQLATENTAAPRVKKPVTYTVVEVEEDNM